MKLGATLLKVAAVAAGACAVLYGVAAAGLWLTQDDYIYYPSKDVVQPSLPYVSAERIPTSDGETLVAWRSLAAPGCPTFLFFDGQGGRPEIQNDRWQRIHEAGLGFLAVYWRGYSGSTGKPSEKGFHLDAHAGLKWLLNQGVPASQIVVDGYSLGTGPATRLASENDVAALILEAPYFSMVEMVTYRVPFAPTALLRSTYRSDQWIGQVSKPVLMVHGTADASIPQSQGQRLFEKAHDPKVFVSMPGSGHGSLVRDGLYDHVWPFLATYLSAQETASCPVLAKLPQTAEAPR